MTTGSVRLDKYLWYIRIFKTRTSATKAIDDGKVTLLGAKLKPSRAVSVGDVYEVKTAHKKWKIEVRQITTERLPFREAVLCYKDDSPLVEKTVRQKSVFVEYTGKRKSKQGRPTKKNRRTLDDFMG